MKSFAVHRKEAVLVTPAAPTPHEFKDLSDIDDQEGLRFQIPFIHFYRKQPPAPPEASGGVVDPVAAIKVALSRALVHYYPFAGRLREGPGRKLSVECTGEGVLFIEADADARLDELGTPLRPPFPYLDELLADVEGSGEILGCPLLLIQVTRLRCGGFVFALRHNHTMSDAQGLVQFMGCLAELSRGASEPSVEPVWARELLCAGSPPQQPRFRHREYDELPGTVVPFEGMEHRSLFFGKREVAAMRSHAPPNLGSSTFEILTACLWRSRTIAIAPDPEEEVRMIWLNREIFLKSNRSPSHGISTSRLRFQDNTTFLPAPGGSTICDAWEIIETSTAAGAPCEKGIALGGGEDEGEEEAPHEKVILVVDEDANLQEEMPVPVEIKHIEEKDRNFLGDEAAAMSTRIDDDRIVGDVPEQLDHKEAAAGCHFLQEEETTTNMASDQVKDSQPPIVEKKAPYPSSPPRLVSGRARADEKKIAKVEKPLKGMNKQGSERRKDPHDRSSKLHFNKPGFREDDKVRESRNEAVGLVGSSLRYSHDRRRNEELARDKSPCLPRIPQPTIASCAERHRDYARHPNLLVFSGVHQLE